MVELLPTGTILLAGPTASGKSALALALAQTFHGTIINADALQVYNPPHILTAQPTTAERQGVPHRLYGFLPPNEVFSVGKWLRAVHTSVREEHAKGRRCLIVGGSGLYMERLILGLVRLPPIPAEVRRKVRSSLASLGAAAMHNRLMSQDPVLAERIAPQDTLRIARALEVWESTGMSLRVWQERQPAPPAQPVRRVLILPSLEDITARSAARLKTMMHRGAIAEVRKMQGLSDTLPAMRALGVRPLLAALDGECTTEEALTRTQTDTRRYARRQRTWFTNRPLPCPTLTVTSTQDEQILPFLT